MQTSGFRHQGFIYNGSTCRPAPAIAAVIKQKLEQKHRCLYFDSEPLVAGLQVDLARLGVDVSLEIARNNLVLSSSLGHLNSDLTFDINKMIAALEDALDQALHDGHAGLWASGDIAWEFGPNRDLAQLAEYETRLETFVSTHEKFSGICLYDAETLPPEAVQTGHEEHPSLFISATESRLNSAFRQWHKQRSTTSSEDILHLFLPDDLLEQATACAQKDGITLDEFVRQAIVEKSQTTNSRKNGKTIH
jgi:hypothetical protein